MENFQLRGWTQPIREAPFLFLVLETSEEITRRDSIFDDVIFLEHGKTWKQEKGFSRCQKQRGKSDSRKWTQQCMALRENISYGLEALVSI